MQVLVRDNNVDQALKALKKKMQREGIFREMKLRNYFEKPSERKARERAEAVRRARKLARKRAQREGLLPGKPAGPQRPGGSGKRPPAPLSQTFARLFRTLYRPETLMRPERPAHGRIRFSGQPSRRGGGRDASIQRKISSVDP